jgi:hypothetical protein
VLWAAATDAVVDGVMTCTGDGGVGVVSAATTPTGASSNKSIGCSDGVGTAAAVVRVAVFVVVDVATDAAPAAAVVTILISLCGVVGGGNITRGVDRGAVDVVVVLALVLLLLAAAAAAAALLLGCAAMTGTTIGEFGMIGHDDLTDVGPVVRDSVAAVASVSLGASGSAGITT